MANDSEPRLDNLGIELRTGPMLGRGAVLETGGQQRWDACTVGKEKVVTHLLLEEGGDSPDSPGSTVAPRTDPRASHPELEVALLLHQLWRALGSCCHRHQWDLKTFFQPLCFSQ